MKRGGGALARVDGGGGEGGSRDHVVPAKLARDQRNAANCHGSASSSCITQMSSANSRQNYRKGRSPHFKPENQGSQFENVLVVNKGESTFTKPLIHVNETRKMAGLAQSQLREGELIHHLCLILSVENLSLYSITCFLCFSVHVTQVILPIFCISFKK